MNTDYNACVSDSICMQIVQCTNAAKVGNMDFLATGFNLIFSSYPKRFVGRKGRKIQRWTAYVSLCVAQGDAEESDGKITL